MEIQDIKYMALAVVKDFSITKVKLLGFRTEGTNRDDSDVDLIVEFAKQVSIMFLAELKARPRMPMQVVYEMD